MIIYNDIGTGDPMTVQGQTIADGDSYQVAAGVQVTWAKDSALRMSLQDGTANISFTNAFGTESIFDSGAEANLYLDRIVDGNMAVV